MSLDALIGGQCPSCKDAGILYLDLQYVRCDNCDFERFSSQEELDKHVNKDRFEKDPKSTRELTLMEPEKFIKPRKGGVKSMMDFEFRPPEKEINATKEQIIEFTKAISQVQSELGVSQEIAMDAVGKYLIVMGESLSIPGFTIEIPSVGECTVIINNKEV